MNIYQYFKFRNALFVKLLLNSTFHVNKGGGNTKLIFDKVFFQ
jgi:hypothetical protein